MNPTRTLQHVVLVLAMVAFGCSKASDPKTVVKNLSDAMHRGDAATVKAGSINGDPAFIDGMAAVAAATNKLHDAAVAKFGKDGEVLADDRIPDIAKRIDTADVKENGDTATITPRGGDQPLTLKKVNGEWKVDFADMGGKGGGEMAPFMQSMAAANSSVADDIAAGKFSTAAEAKKAIREKMMAAVTGGFSMHKMHEAASATMPAQMPTATPDMK